ncbi:VOC family protein [Chitinophaga sp. SYP-B3965]|uniref:VOC family protein n=1 Tax=Chitinophaga sp. SYP-B3965 TaxID=2663120 RepID=UPI001299B6AA|nr:VOC family protein [Chitinophaga sp. SYP-B3965]MRG45444.1 VOC family protein [Chitinophaga sp. SYP-B3965]
MAVSPYFLVKDGAAFLSFMTTVFDATVAAVHHNDNGGIMHGEVNIDDSIVMFGESTSAYPPETGSVFVYVKDTDETYKKAMAAGAVSRQEPMNKDYGRAAGVRDPFGNTWWITQVL